MTPSDPDAPGRTPGSPSDDATVVSQPGGTTPPAARGETRPSGGTIPIGGVISHTYRIEQLLAIGGMGEVYRARHLFNQRAYALKMIKPEFASDDRIIALFRREAGILESIRNPVIVGYSGLVLDENNHPFLVMEYVDGPSLADLIGRRRFSVGEVRQLRDRLAGALAETHRAGIVHRDISPDNIVLQDGDINQPKIIDFGIARQEAAATTLIGDGFAGKYRYASPEHLGAHGGQVDGRSDVYSLGLVLAAVARGNPLDMGHSPTELLARRADVPDLEGVPEDLWPDLTAMLHPNPADRPDTAADLIGMGAPAKAGETRRRGDARSGGGGKGRTLALAAGLLLLAGGAGAGLWVWQGGLGSGADGPGAVADTPADGPATPASGANTTTTATGPTIPQADTGGTAATDGSASSDAKPERDAETEAIIAQMTPRPRPDNGPTAGDGPESDGATETTPDLDQTASTTAPEDGPPGPPDQVQAEPGTETTTAPSEQVAVRPPVPDPGALTADLPCSALTVSFDAGMAASASGYLESRDDLDTLRARLADVPGLTGIDTSGVAVAPRPLCAILGTLEDWRFRDGPTIGFGNGTGRYRVGEFLTLDIQTTLPQSHLHAVFIDSNERLVLHMLPNPVRRDTAASAGETISLGAPEASPSGVPRAYEMAPPAGRHMVLVAQSPVPLFPELRPEVEPLQAFLEDLLRQETESGPMLRFTYAFIDIVP
ncbi:protein kinase domain-containing protein [Roseospira navarrensis]|uniref:Protein kinase n=1 Tax=Roseospira navarrensis TaxID=140058 RepID=A0A7X1ZE47_9PROT|nr:protein kinase [Roseospira navarrensis]MQX36379.1 protein kinase [Roseospira navarrensis]